MPYKVGVDPSAQYLASSTVANFWSYAFDLIREGLCSNAQDIYCQMVIAPICSALFQPCGVIAIDLDTNGKIIIIWIVIGPR
tara:strand:+ start:153 stop:398 length:246 start_codon:yes stop_codon:yes gene_type:complete